jgi:hypothetical protein
MSRERRSLPNAKNDKKKRTAKLSQGELGGGEGKRVEVYREREGEEVKSEREVGRRE